MNGFDERVYDTDIQSIKIKNKIEQNVEIRNPPIAFSGDVPMPMYKQHSNVVLLACMSR